MSATPRTDVAIRLVYQAHGAIEYTRAEFARTLERELAAVTAERDALRQDAQTLVAGLHAELAERDAEVARLRDANSTFASAAIKPDEPRTDAEWVAGDRRRRINDLAARYAEEIANAVYARNSPVNFARIAEDARALAAAVVEAEE
jgi:hypothetical protein